MAEPTALFPTWKFHAPVLPALRDEPPVVGRIAEALTRRPAVVVVAPAGSGKTTALAAWSANPAPLRPLWVRLDAQDDDPLTLTAALAQAIRVTFDHEPVRIDRMLDSPVAPELNQLATAVAVELEDLDQVALVLDDVHHLRSSASLHLLEALWDGLAASCRLVVASRTEPSIALPMRRVRRQVHELRAPDLRLDRPQIEALLADHDVHDDATTDAVLQRCSGWAAAAVLLAANLGTGSSEAQRRQVSLRSSEAEVDEFLRSELLAHLDPELREFVLDTSLLAELDPQACREVTEREVGDVTAMLEQVRRRGLAERVVTTEGPDPRTALRYHERIAAFLRTELAAQRSPDRLAELHRRAARVSPPMQAVELLVAIGDTDAAASMVADEGRRLLQTPGGRVPRSWLTPFQGSASASEPWVELLCGLAAIEDGDIAAAVSHLAPSTAEMRERGDRAGFFHSAYGLAEADLMAGRVDEAAGLFDELLALDTTPDERVKVLAGNFWLEFFGCRWPELAGHLEEAFALAFTSCTELGRSSLALGLGTELLFAPTGATWLSERAAEMARRLERDEMARTSLEVMQAAAHLMGGRLDLAAELAEGVDEQVLELGSLNWLAMAADRVRLGIALSSGDHQEVERIVDAARRILAESGRHHQERAMYAYAAARSALLTGQLEQVGPARLILGEVTDEDRPDAGITAAVLDALELRRRGDLEAAETVLSGVSDFQRTLRFCLLTGLVDPELAAVRLALGRPDDAVATVRPTLALLERIGGLGILAIDGPGTHVDVLRACNGDPEVGAAANAALDLLQHRVRPAGVLVAATGERITSREMEVLELVIAGETNRGVAERLYIGERTVKSHMTSLMRKLGVGSRTAAVARSRELGIG